MSYRRRDRDPGAPAPPPPVWRNVTLPATAEYSDWVHGLADRLGLTLTGAVATGLRRLAAAEGHPSPPPRLPQLCQRPAADPPPPPPPLPDSTGA